VIGRVLRILAMAVAMLFVASCSSDARPLTYLATLPEKDLSYPGATLLKSGEHPREQGIDSVNPATIWRMYRAVATKQDVIDWFGSELESRGWRSDNVYVGAHDYVPQWKKDFAAVQISHLRSEEEAPQEVSFEVELMATESIYDWGPTDILKAQPELTISYPGSEPTEEGLEMSRSISRRVYPAHVDRDYAVRATGTDVELYFDHELLARGWEPVVPPPADVGFGYKPTRVWHKEGLYAGLSIWLKAKPTGDGSTVRYSFALAEEPGPEVTPGYPWD
jgi:hypothetical protein